MTDCTNSTFHFQALGRRAVMAQFDGGTLTSDGGALVLREWDARRHIIKQFAACFTDHRQPDLIEHPLQDLIAQRVYGLALGYEDLNDHDLLRCDPLLAIVIGKTDPTGKTRRRTAERGKALAGKSTLNRLELRSDDPAQDGNYQKIALDAASVDRFFVEVFLQAHPQPPRSIILDLDATDDPLHGQQEGRFFHGYYRQYCYLPLYIFCGDFLLCARLREANQDQSAGAVEEIKRIVEQIRAHWPALQITLRGDSGFAREKIMRWCEEHGVD